MSVFTSVMVTLTAGRASTANDSGKVVVVRMVLVIGAGVMNTVFIDVESGKVVEVVLEIVAVRY